MRMRNRIAIENGKYTMKTDDEEEEELKEESFLLHCNDSYSEFQCT